MERVNYSNYEPIDDGQGSNNIPNKPSEDVLQARDSSFPSQENTHDFVQQEDVIPSNFPVRRFPPAVFDCALPRITLPPDVVNKLVADGLIDPSDAPELLGEE